jgi:hypothetical protein
LGVSRNSTYPMSGTKVMETMRDATGEHVITKGSEKMNSPVSPCNSRNSAEFSSITKCADEPKSECQNQALCRATLQPPIQETDQLSGRPQPDLRIRLSIFGTDENGESMGIQSSEGILIRAIVSEIGDRCP